MEVQTLKQLILPVSLILGGYILGIFFEKIILAKLKKVAEKTEWDAGEIIVGALRGTTVLWLTIAGIYGALLTVEMRTAILDAYEKILVVVVIFSGTVVLARIAVGFVKAYSRKVADIMPSSIFINFTRIIIFVVGALIILQTVGVSITPVLTALGVGGLAVALALQEPLANLFAGFHIIASGQVKPGNYIKLESGEEGFVVDVTWRNTSIRALPNNMIIVPNSKLASAVVTNFHLPETQMSVLVQVGVSYDSDLEKVEKATIEVAKEVMREVQGGVPDFEPFIRYHTFSDFSIQFTVILRAREFVDQYLLKHEFVKRLHRRYSAEGIEIPFPIRTVFMKGQAE